METPHSSVEASVYLIFALLITRVDSYILRTCTTTYSLLVQGRVIEERTRCAKIEMKTYCTVPVCLPMILFIH
jgi:hypothetical protein